MNQESEQVTTKLEYDDQGQLKKSHDERIKEVVLSPAAESRALFILAAQALVSIILLLVLAVGGVKLIINMTSIAVDNQVEKIER